MFVTKLARHEQQKFYSVDDGNTIIRFKFSPQGTPGTAGGRVAVHFARVSRTGTVTYKPAAPTQQLTAKHFNKASPGADRFAGAIVNYLKQYKNVKELTPGAVIKHIMAQGAGRPARKTTPRTQPPIFKKITISAAKKLTQEFTDFYYADKKHVLALACPDRDEPQQARVLQLSFTSPRLPLAVLKASFIKDGLHADRYRETKKANPHRGQWVWVQDGVETSAYNAPGLTSATLNYLHTQFKRIEKIDNFTDYVTNVKRTARLAKKRTGRSER